MIFNRDATLVEYTASSPVRVVRPADQLGRGTYTAALKRVEGAIASQVRHRGLAHDEGVSGHIEEWDVQRWRAWSSERAINSAGRRCRVLPGLLTAHDTTATTFEKPAHDFSPMPRRQRSGDLLVDDGGESSPLRLERCP